MDKVGLPNSREQHDWFYRRSGMMMRSPFMLNSLGAITPRRNFWRRIAMAEAGKDLGVNDDRVRLAIAEAALREGKRIGDGMSPRKLRRKRAAWRERNCSSAPNPPRWKSACARPQREFHALKSRSAPLSSSIPTLATARSSPALRRSRRWPRRLMRCWRTFPPMPHMPRISARHLHM